MHNTIAKQQLGTFFKWNVFNILYFDRETFRIWAKISDKILHSSFFVCRSSIGTFFQRFRHFLDCELKYYSFGSQVSNRVFESALKMWTTAYLFFLGSLKFFFFIAVNWAENFQTLRKTSRKKSSVFPFPCAEDIWYFFYPKK